MFLKIKYMFLKNIHLVSLREHRTYVLVGKFFQKINFSKKQKNNFSKKSNFPEKFIFRVRDQNRHYLPTSRPSRKASFARRGLLVGNAITHYQL